MELYQFSTIVAVQILINLLFHFLKSYSSEKGKNLATKEDVAEITEKIESVKKEFTLLVNEHQVKFSYLHIEKAKAIIKLYRKLTLLELTLNKFFNPFQQANRDYKKEFKDSQNKIRNFIIYYNKNKIFYCKEIRYIVDSINSEIKKSWFNYTIDPPIEHRTSNIDVYKENFKMWNDAWESIDMKIPGLKLELENEMSKIIEP